MKDQKLFKDLRRHVKIELAKRDKTQSQLANELGVSRQYLNNMYLGKVSTFNQTRERLLTALEKIS